MDADEFIINVIAKKNNGTIELSVPDDIFNQAERILLKNEQGVFCKTFPAEVFGSDSWISVKDELPKIPKEDWSAGPFWVYDKEVGQREACYTKAGEWLDGREYYELKCVTHWMPLPVGPQEVNND